MQPIINDVKNSTATGNIPNFNFTPVVVNNENKDFLHDLIASTLMRIDGAMTYGAEIVTIENIHPDKSINDKILDEIMRVRQFVLMLDNGQLVLTDNGRLAIDKRIAVVYPLGPNSGVKSYDKTLLNMTDSGRNAFFISLSNNINILTKVPRTVLASLFTSITKVGIFQKLPVGVNIDIKEAVESNIETHRYSLPFAEAMQEYSDELVLAEAKIRTYFAHKIRKVGDVKVKQEVYLDKNIKISTIKVEDDEIVFYGTDPLTLDTFQYSIDDISIATLTELSYII